MKTLLISLTFSLLSIILVAQDFAPTGSEWYYNEQYAFSGDIDYIKFVSEKDTLINGQTCQKIVKYDKLECNDRPNIEFVFTRNDTVFFLDTIFQQFQILYAFNAKPKDSWIIKEQSINHEIDTIQVVVDSISIKQINDILLRVLYVTYDYLDENRLEKYESSIIEKIGDLHYMFNWLPSIYEACDANYTTGLRCYQDQQLGLFSTGISESCDYQYKWVGVPENHSKSIVDIYPNPTNADINIATDVEGNYSAEIYDSFGTKIESQYFNSKGKIDLSKYSAGIYFLIINQDNKIIKQQTIIKQ